VKVLEVDLARKRISLTMKLDTKPAQGGAGGNSFKQPGRNERVGGQGARQANAAPQGQSAMAAAFAKLQSKS
jgi:uncharacterized protein